MVIFPIEQLSYYQNFAFREKFFSPEECDRILALLNQYPPQEATVRRDDAVGALGTDEAIRKSRVTFIPMIKEAEWIHQKLAAAAIECNKALYNFQLTGFLEGLQLGQYQAGHFYGWHMDFGYREMSIRKLSIVAQLTDPSQYEGGDLELYSGKTPMKAVRTRGALIFFPSFVLHRITPITSGVRHSLVGWVSGPPFR